jgi:hypothetical protein
MAETKNLQELMNEAVQAAASALAEQFGVDMVMCTKWLCIAEWSDVAGGQWLTTRSSSDITSWAARGMLEEAIEETRRVE